jgi:hypothetical protein
VIVLFQPEAEVGARFTAMEGQGDNLRPTQQNRWFSPRLVHRLPSNVMMLKRHSRMQQ